MATESVKQLGNIVDEITVSAISGNNITLSAAQDVQIGNELKFSKGGWNIGDISTTIAKTSGTTSVSITTTHRIDGKGIADITCALDLDDFASVKPNAFPISVYCPAGGNVVINAVTDCINWAGGFGDNDSNQETKEYIIHSIPSASTSSRAETDVYGTLSLSAAESMGSTGTGAVTYTADVEMVAGDTDYFYYKTTDAQTSAVTSSLTQGKISITIV